MDAQLREQQYAHVVGQAQVEIAPRRGRIEALADLDGAFDLAEGLAEAARQAHGLGRGRHAFGDRKSTRLNSSHLVISYAVFCLKKKKIKDVTFCGFYA